MTVGFSFVGSKNTSLKYPWKDAFTAMIFFIFTNIDPLIVIVLTKSSAFMNQYFNDKASILKFDSSEGKQLSYFQNGIILKILLSFHEPHNQVKYR